MNSAALILLHLVYLEKYSAFMHKEDFHLCNIRLEILFIPAVHMRKKNSSYPFMYIKSYGMKSICLHFYLMKSDSLLFLILHKLYSTQSRWWHENGDYLNAGIENSIAKTDGSEEVMCWTRRFFRPNTQPGKRSYQLQGVTMMSNITCDSLDTMCPCVDVGQSRSISSRVHSPVILIMHRQFSNVALIVHFLGWTSCQRYWFRPISVFRCWVTGFFPRHTTSVLLMILSQRVTHHHLSILSW